MLKKLIILVSTLSFPFIASAQSSAVIHTTKDAIVCSTFRDATRLEKAIKQHNVRNLMELMNSGRCWEVGEQRYIALDYDPNDYAQHIMLSDTAGGALLTIFIK